MFWGDVLRFWVMVPSRLPQSLMINCTWFSEILTNINCHWYIRIWMENLPPVSISIANFEAKKQYSTRKFSYWLRKRNDEKMRTTNACEGWNNSWNRKNTRTRPNFWVSMRFLKLQERKTRNKIAHLNRGRTPALQKMVTNNSQILALKNSFTLGNRSVDSYWDTLAQFCNTI